MKQFILLSLLALVGLTSCQKKTTVSVSESGTYACPMKCEGEKTYNKPGQCPKCNMDLQKVEEMHEHHEHDSTHTNH